MGDISPGSDWRQLIMAKSLLVALAIVSNVLAMSAPNNDDSFSLEDFIDGLSIEGMAEKAIEFGHQSMNESLVRELGRWYKGQMMNIFGEKVRAIRKIHKCMETLFVIEGVICDPRAITYSFDYVYDVEYFYYNDKEVEAKCSCADILGYVTRKNETAEAY